MQSLQLVQFLSAERACMHSEQISTYHITYHAHIQKQHCKKKNKQQAKKTQKHTGRNSVLLRPDRYTNTDILNSRGHVNLNLCNRTPKQILQRSYQNTCRYTVHFKEQCKAINMHDITLFILFFHRTQIFSSTKNGRK